MSEFHERWRLDISVHWGRPKLSGWRARLGRSLRRLADRVDGRRSLAVSLVTEPPLPANSVHECFKQAAVAMEWAATQECQAEARERIMRRAVPRLYVA